jgi:hypothetical protein
MEQSQELVDPEFGTLKWQGKYTLFVTREDISDVPVDIQIELDPHKERRLDFLERARDIFASLLEQEHLFRTTLAENFVKHYNDVWSEGETQMELDEFMSHMKLVHIIIADCINADEDFSITIYYDVGDLFADHPIEAMLNNQFQIVHTDTPG